jgi:hypothetical protein
MIVLLTSLLMRFGLDDKLSEGRFVVVMILRRPGHTGVLLLMMPGGIVAILLITLIVGEITPVFAV